MGVKSLLFSTENAVYLRSDKRYARVYCGSLIQSYSQGRCHVHFHSIEVARFLFARWRGWAR